MFLKPNWPAPAGIKALCTTRQGGVSRPPFDSFNIATHVGDNLDDVMTNRHLLVERAKLPAEPFWLDQQHTDEAIHLTNPQNTQTELSQTLTPPIADASWTTQAGLVSVVMTADCLPVLITNQAGTLVAAIHAGWKGLQKGIVTKTVAAFASREDCQSEQLLAWIGPAISLKHFEVGQDVLDAFVQSDEANKAFFHQVEGLQGKYLADLVGLVTKELNEIGISAVYGGDHCSYAESDLFYSYRLSGVTGRMASMIWIEPI